MKIIPTEEYDAWFKGLKDKKAKAKILIRIDRVKAGNFGDCESVGGGVSELRLKYGPGYRVYLGKRRKEVVILIGGSAKKNQQNSIDEAKERWKELKKQ